MSKLPNQVNQYFTDELVVKYSDFTESTDDTAQTFTYAVPAGSIVTAVAASLRTAFTDSGSGDDLIVTVGDGTDVDGFLVSAQLHNDGTAITVVANDGAYIDNENGKVYTSADTIDITFTPNVGVSASYALSETTAGEIVFKFAIIEIDPEG